MKNRKPFTEAENTIKKCLIKAAERLHGGSKAVDRVKKVPLFDTTMARRCTLLAKNLKEQLLVKLRMSACFGVQLDESVNLSGEAQLLVYCGFLDTITSKMTEHKKNCK